MLPVDPVSMGWLKGLVLFLLVAMMLAKARVGGARVALACCDHRAYRKGRRHVAPCTHLCAVNVLPGMRVPHSSCAFGTVKDYTQRVLHVLHGVARGSMRSTR